MGRLLPVSRVSTAVVVALVRLALPTALASQVVPPTLLPSTAVVEPKLSTKASPALRRLAPERAGTATPRAVGPIVLVDRARVVDDRVLIDAAAEFDGQALLADLEQLGLVDGVAFGRVVSGWLPLGAIARLESLDSLRLARPSVSSHAAGSVTSQGVTATGADFYLGSVDGTGTTVGIISDSWNCLGGAPGDVTSGDLPAGVVVLEEGVCATATDEGRAMGQIVHDMAPGADLLFHTAFGGAAAMAQGILDLEAAGAAIIVDDVRYFDQPMFQDGIIAQAVDQVADLGVAYFSAAGNLGRQSYESAWRSSGSQLCPGCGLAHDFDPGAGVDAVMQVTIPTGPFTILLQWDSPFGSVGVLGSLSDLDLYLLDDPVTGVVLSSLTNNVGGDAIEMIIATNAGPPDTFNLAITFDHLVEPSVPPSLVKVVILEGDVTFNQFATDSSTLYGHPNAAGAIAVGAVNFFQSPAFGVDPPLLAPYSSAGGTPILFDTDGFRLMTPEVRNKPELTCIDGGNNTFFGSDVGQDADAFPNFFGTSAAAPHAAGIAAVMLDERVAADGLPLGPLREAFSVSAVDMGPAGFDFDSGDGLCSGVAVFQVPVALEVTKTPLVATLPEPGGAVNFQVTVAIEALFTTATAASLVDDLHGNLDGQGSCALPQVLSPGFPIPLPPYLCTYSAMVTGTAGVVPTGTVSVAGTSLIGLPLADQAPATSVTLTDVQPALVVTRSAVPETLLEPGGPVTFTVRIDNTSPGDPLQLTSLTDDVHGNLDGRGNCGLPQSIPLGGFYECSYSEAVTGAPGPQTSTTSAVASDDESNAANGSDGATVTLLSHEIFADGFESGDLSAWSGSLP